MKPVPGQRVATVVSSFWIRAVPYILLTSIAILPDPLPCGEALSDTTIVVTFGNSIAQGFIEGELDTVNRYSNRLRELLLDRGGDWCVINEGRGGENSIQALDRLEEDVLNQQPDYVTVSYGSNDYWIGGEGEVSVPIEDFKEALSLITSSLELNRKKPILLSMPPLIVERLENSIDPSRFAPYGGIGELHDLYNEAIREVARQECVPVIDLVPAFQDSLEVALGSDGHHPTPLGHRIIAREILAEIDSLESQEYPSGNHTAREKENRFIETFYSYPNPFVKGGRRFLRVQYSLSSGGLISLEVFTITGRKVARIHDEERRDSGGHLTHWDLRTSGGDEVPSGVYLLNLQFRGDDGARDNRAIKTAVIK